MWYILSSEIVHYTKGLFFCNLGLLFITFQTGLIGFFSSLLVLYFCFSKSVVGTLRYLRYNFIILESLCKNMILNIMIISEAKKRWVKNPYELSLTFCRITVYDLECFRCVWIELLSRIYLTLIPFGLYFTGLIIMVHHPYTW